MEFAHSVMKRFITAAALALAVACAQAATQAEEMSRTMQISDYPAQVEKLLKNGSAATALELAEIGLKKNDKSAQLRFQRAVALERLGRTDEAVEALKSLIDAYPEIPEPYNNLAVIEAARGDLESAEKHLQKVLLINPDFALARKNLGDVYLALALECYEKAAPSFSRSKDVQQRLKSLRRLNGAEADSAE